MRSGSLQDGNVRQTGHRDDADITTFVSPLPVDSLIGSKRYPSVGYAVSLQSSTSYQQNIAMGTGVKLKYIKNCG